MKSFGKFFRNPGVSDQAQIAVAKMYMLSHGLFQSSTWPALDNLLSSRVHHTVMHVYRTAVSQLYKRQGTHIMSDIDLLLQYDLLNAKSLLRHDRLQLVSRILSKKPETLHAQQTTDTS